MSDYLFMNNYEDMIELFPEEKSNIDRFLYDEPFLFAINGKVEMIGDCEIENNKFYMKDIVSIHAKQGHGRLLIQHLLDELKIEEIWGEATPDAFPFWFKIGAEFEKSSYRHFMENDDDEDDFLVPFTITKR